jgi:ligand-binding sensor domain-containing protein
MHRILLAFFYFFLPALFAQTPAYLHYGVADGLPGNQVYCGLQDSRGLLWFGTDKGLAQFDGSRFRVYSMTDGLPDLEVLNMKEDSKGRLWLFCFRKKPCYIYQGRIYSEKQDTLLPKIDFAGGTYNISEDGAGNIWHFAPSYKVYVLGQDTVYSHHFPKGSAGLYNTGDRLLILGTHCIMQFRQEGNADIIYEVSTEIDPPSIGVSGNRILYSYSRKNILLEWKDGKINKIAEQSKPTGQVYTDKSGRFWICSPPFGAICFDNDQQTLKNPVGRLSGKKVTTMFEDRQGTFWFCTSDEGIWAFRKSSPVTFHQPQLASNNIRYITGDQPGNIYAGDDIGNVHTLSAGQLHTFSMGARDGYNMVRQILPTESGRKWIASDEVLLHLSETGKVIRSYDIKSSLKGISLQENRLWFAASSKLGYIENDGATIREVVKARFTAICTDGQQNIWAGSMQGLYSQADGFQVNRGGQFPALNSRIITIQPRDRGRIWVVTQENGLLSVTVNNGDIIGVDVINNKLKQKILNIQAVCSQPDGTVWLATNRGVYGINSKYNILYYNRNDGLADDDVNALFVRNDTLWAGTVGGLTCIQLKSDADDANFPTLLTRLLFQQDNSQTGIYLSDTFSGTREIILPASASNIVLEMAGLDYRSSGNLFYRVEQSELLLPVLWWTIDNLATGIRNSFTSVTTSWILDKPAYNLGNYLPPGRYRFKVTASKPNGQLSNVPDTWTIVKRPYWHETLWFYALLWALISLIAYRIYKTRKGYHEARTAVSVLQLQALQAQINPHFIGNAINAIQQFLHPPNPVKASNYISMFMRLLHRTMLFSEKSIITFKEELEYVREYMELVRLRFEDRFQFEILVDEGADPDMPIPSMILQPVLENATLHGLAPEGLTIIKMRFRREQDFFVFTLCDNGIGIKEKQRIKRSAPSFRESRGLTMLQKKLETLNKLYNLDISMTIKDLSEQNTGQTGTCITIKYRINNTWKISD